MRAVTSKRNRIIAQTILLVGVLGMPGAGLDTFGEGSRHGSPTVGGNILVYCTTEGNGYDRTYFDENLPTILGNYGYSVTVTDRITTPEITDSILGSYDQLWVLSTDYSSGGCFTSPELAAIAHFREAGNGLLIMADDGIGPHDYQRDANQISVPLGVTFYGEENHGPEGGCIAPSFQAHELLAGVVTISGSTSEGNMNVSDPAEVIATYHGDNLIALRDHGNGRVVFDVSFTRLWDTYILGCDNTQYVRNIAGWLMAGVEQLPIVLAGPDTNPEDGTHDDSPFEFNESVFFEGQVIPDEGAVIDSSRWDFDDGISVKDTLNVQHEYTNLYGEHTAILAAWDDRGLWASDTLGLFILGPDPPQVNSISALYDGISHEDTIGIFISGFTASNSFYANITEGGLTLDSVVFQVAGISTHGNYEGGGVWEAEFSDIGSLPAGDNVLTVTAFDVDGSPGQKNATVKMRDTPSWFNGEWISLIEHHEEYEFVTTGGTPYYYMQISIPEPPVEWGPYDFSIEPFFPDLSNHFRVFLGIKGRFNINGLWSDHEVGGELIAKLLGKGIDENVNVEEGDMRFEGPYNDLVGVTISGLGYEIPNQTLFGASGWLATFWVGAVQIDLFYSAAFGLKAYIDLGAEFSIDTNYDSYVYLNPGIQPWVSLDVWASVLFGVAEIGMNFTPTFGIEFPCTLFVYPDPHAATHHCTYFVLYYSVWGSVGWGLWKGTLWGPEAGFHFDEPEGCHWGEYEFEVAPPIAAMIDSVLQYLPQVFETPSTAVDPNSNRAFVVWIRDQHPEDTLLTDPEVYYGYLDSTEGAEWVYGSITDNDRWETNPKVAFLSSDSVIAVWTQNEIPKADWGSVTELNTVLSNQELYYSIWTVSSGSWTVPIRITTNSLPDGCPDLHARNGKAILAWVRDLDGDLNTRADWEVFYSWFDTGGWSTPAVLSEGSGSNFEPAGALDDSTGQAIVVWTHEPDGNFNTPDDRGLYYKYIDPTTGPGPLGTDLPHEMGPLSPSVAFAPGRNPVVAYTSRSVEWDSVSGGWDTLGVGLRDELFFSYYKASAWHSMQVSVDGDSVIAMNPVVKVDEENRAMIVYRGFEGEGVAGFDGEIFSIYIDLSSGAPKGENHVQYTSDTATTWMPAFDINSEGEGKLVYVSYSPEPPDTGFDNMHIESPAWVSHYLRGDANGDQTIDVGDVVYLVNYLYRSGSAPDPLWTGDANCDLVTNIGDVVYLVNYLYRGGDPPPHCG